MAKTKRELEQEIRIYKMMYEKAHEERMHYYFILNDIANGFNRCALNRIVEYMDKDYLINNDLDVTAFLIAKKLKGE